MPGGGRRLFRNSHVAALMLNPNDEAARQGYVLGISSLAGVHIFISLRYGRVVIVLSAAVRLCLNAVDSA